MGNDDGMRRRRTSLGSSAVERSLLVIEEKWKQDDVRLNLSVVVR